MAEGAGGAVTSLGSGPTLYPQPLSPLPLRTWFVNVSGTHVPMATEKVWKGFESHLRLEMSLFL